MAESDWAESMDNIRGLCHRRTADSAMRCTDRCRRITGVYVARGGGMHRSHQTQARIRGGNRQAAPDLTPRGPERLHISRCPRRPGSETFGFCHHRD